MGLWVEVILGVFSSAVGFQKKLLKFSSSRIRRRKVMEMGNNGRG